MHCTMCQTVDWCCRETHTLCMKHKEGVAISKLRSLTGGDGKPMSQIAFAKFIGIPSGTLARVEAGAVPLPWEAAERIEAACGVDADKLYEGQLCALDGNAYTTKHWVKRQNLELSDVEMRGIYEEMALRLRLLLGGLGRRRAIYGASRLRQMLEAIREESGVADASIEMVARADGHVEVKHMTAAALAQQEDVPPDIVAKLKKLPPRKKCRVTVEQYFTWPPYRMETVANVFGYTARTLWRADLPDGTREDWVITRSGGRGRGVNPTPGETAIWSTSPKLDAVGRAMIAPRLGPSA
jgi:transcriptional regulator with XRE-family HTH domain